MIEEDKNCLDLFRYKEEKIVAYWDIMREQVPCLEILELGGEKKVSTIAQEDARWQHFEVYVASFLKNNFSVNFIFFQ